MYDHKIDTIDDVKAFFRFLIEQKSLNFHPDDDFSEYINIKTNEPTFSEREITHYNKLMEDCFEVCHKENVEIYSIAMIVLKDQSKQ